MPDIHSKYVTKMIKLISFRSLLSLGVAALLSQAVLANEGLTPAEANTMVKEDIASAQVMIEVCPAIIGKTKIRSQYASTDSILSAKLFR